MNRSHPASGTGPAAVHVAASNLAVSNVTAGNVTAGAVAATATLPSDQFEDETAFLHGDVLHRDAFCLPAHGASVAAARHRVGELLYEWGVARTAYEDAALVVSELFTNALVHTDSAEITCRLQTTTETIYLAITDQGCGVTEPQVREPEAENGRGLLLVNALAELWGVRNEHGCGRTVWAVLPVESDESTLTDA